MTTTQPPDMSVIQRILAEAYKEGEHQEPSYNVIRELNKLVYREYNKVSSLLNIQFVDCQPYTDYQEMKHHAERKRELHISTLNSNSLILRHENNLKFRAIHDYHHITLNQGFDMAGEFVCTKAMMALTGNHGVRFVLFSEIAMQAAYALEYGEFSDIHKVVRFEGQAL